MEVTFTGRRNMPGRSPCSPEQLAQLLPRILHLPSSPSLLAPSSSGPSAPFTVTSPEPQSGRVPVPVSPPCLLETRAQRYEALPRPKGTPVQKHS